MPGYKTHDKIGLAAVIPVSATSVYIGASFYDTAVLAIGIIAGTFFLSPDLDLHSRIYRRWGILRWIWIPYQKVIHHRSWVSHSGPISATLRILYLYLWFLPLFLYMNISLPIYNLQFIHFCVMLWIAVMIADTVHVLADLFLKGG